MKRSTSIASLGGAFCVLAVGVEAQEVQGGTGLTLEEITVTARKREESLQTTPVAVTAFGGEALEVRAAQSVDARVAIRAERAVRWRRGA